MDMTHQNTNPCSLLVVIVNYRTAHLTIDCLRSLEGEVRSRPDTRVVVVDNASGDHSADAINAAITGNGWESWAAVLPSDHNGGFAYGNNLAIRPTLQTPDPPSYFLLLNSDTQVRPGVFKALIGFMEQHSDVGIVGSSLENPDGTIWSTAFRFPSVLGELEHGVRLGIVSKLLAKWAVVQRMTNEPQQVDWLPGASMMIRRQVFESVGLMDENYFLYYEETDFCLQAKRNGWSCWYVPDGSVMHIAGASTGVTSRDDRPKRLPQYLFDSRRRYFLKNHGFLYAALADLTWSLSFAFWRMRRAVQRKPDADPPYLLLDSLQNSVFLKWGSKGL